MENTAKAHSKRLKSIYEESINKFGLNLRLEDYFQSDRWTSQGKEKYYYLMIKTLFPFISDFFHPNLIVEPEDFDLPAFNTSDLKENYKIAEHDGKDYFPGKSFDERNSLLKKVIKYDQGHATISDPIWRFLRNHRFSADWWIAHHDEYLSQGILGLVEYREFNSLIRKHRAEEKDRIEKLRQGKLEVSTVADGLLTKIADILTSHEKLTPQTDREAHQRIFSV